MQAAAAHLGPRQPLLLFPEGLGGVAGGGSGAFKSGVGLLALELGVPVVPIYIRGTVDTTRIDVGTSIDPADSVTQRAELTSYEVYREITADIRARLRDLAQQQDRI